MDCKEKDLRVKENLQAAVDDSVTPDGEPTGSRVYLLQHKEVHEEGVPHLTKADLGKLLGGSNVEEGVVAGQVLKAGGNIVLLRAEVKQDPPWRAWQERECERGKAWLWLLRRMVNAAVIEVEYTDARGVKMPNLLA